MPLHFKTVGEGRPIIILHGFLGSSDNWITVARSLKGMVYLVDLPNHGQSPHTSAFSHADMMQQVQQFITQQDIKDPVVVGHSLGGKVAMELAVAYGVAGLVVVDIAPRHYPVHHQQILNGLHHMNLEEIASRADADQQLSAYISDPGVRQFLLKNLHRTTDGFEWRINLDVISSNIEEVGKSLTDGSTFAGPTLFIAGGKSDYIQTSDHDQIKSAFPNSRIVTVQGAGHWVHAEQPKEVVRLVNDFADSV